MANTISSFYQTLVAATVQAAAVLRYNCRIIDSVYVDYKPMAASLGQTLDIPIPVSRLGGIIDLATNPIASVDAVANTKAIVFNKHPGDVLKFNDFEQYNSVAALRAFFLDGALKGIQEFINADLASLFTAGNFPTNTAIATTGGLVTTTQFLAGMAALSDQKVPVTDADNMTLALGSLPYTKVLGDANWTTSQIVGQEMATEIRRSGEIEVSYGCKLKLDQQMPVSGSVGTRTFTAAYFHKWALALATRPLAQPQDNTVDCTYVDFGGIPIRVMMSYVHYPVLGYVVTVDAGYGRSVIRPEMCQIFTVAE